MRHLIALLVASSLLAGCQITIGGPSEAEIAAENLHELRMACLDGGHEWDTSTGACVTPPTPIPEPTAATEEPTAPPPTEPPPTPPSVEDLVARAQLYVVRIDHAKACGSGVMLGKDGLIVTNYHVIEGASPLDLPPKN